MTTTSTTTTTPEEDQHAELQEEIGALRRSVDWDVKDLENLEEFFKADLAADIERMSSGSYDEEDQDNLSSSHGTNHSTGSADIASSSMATNTSMRKPKPMMAGRPVTGAPAPNSDLIFFVNAAFRDEYQVCAQLTTDHAVVAFECDIVQKLNAGQTLPYLTSLRVPKGCLMRAKVHPIFRRLLVQSMWIQQQPAMLRYQKGQTKIDPTAPVCSCANPPCGNPAVRFVGNPGFFLQKNLLIDPFCVPVCLDTKCVLQAQQMSNTIHAKAQQHAANSNLGQTSKFATASNPALKSQMPHDVHSCNVCGSFERKYGGSAHVLKACPLCGIAYYCSQQCQIQDWQRGHKDVCTNVKGTATGAQQQQQQQTQVKAAAVDSNSTKKPEPPATIPEETPIIAPAPSPIPYQMPVAAPAPAPMPLRTTAPPQKKQPSPPAKQQPTSSSNNNSMTEVTQGMAAISMPTYNMPEPEVVATPQHRVSAPPTVPVPTYNMPEPAVPVYPAPPKRAVSEGMAPYSVPTFPGNTNNNNDNKDATNTTATTTTTQKGRKKAE
ncbi:expressed unknown protein [Seminavis robusta]|uniref:MYND-type domain-containing protein n=1 Tax=Seminavis robusta TaxID=568900 RepID=A0A9N8DW66_9STRA|nr:expressed unknown protein [Seminavis robusta]|eukprot:Sro389_g132670.1 n/a (548) ;mRNA; f:51530-53173